MKAPLSPAASTAADLDADRQLAVELIAWRRSLNLDDLGPEAVAAITDAATACADIADLEAVGADPEAIAFLAGTFLGLLLVARHTHERETGQTSEPRNPMSRADVHRLVSAPYEDAARGVCKRVRRRSAATLRMIHPARTRSRTARPRERRAAASSTTSGSDPGDDGPSHQAPPEVHLWRRSRYGACNPALLRALIAGERVAS